MSFTQFSTDVKNLENLGTNRPNKDLGLSGLQLRQKFDKAVSDLKTFINGTLIVELESALGAGNIGITTPAGMQSLNVQQAINELHSEATADIEDGSVTTGKIASNAVTAGKLASNAVTAAKIADNAVTRSKLANETKYSQLKSITATYSIVADDLGKTLAPSYTVTGEIVVTLPESVGSDMPLGAEIAILRRYGSSLKIVFGTNMDSGIVGDSYFNSNRVYAIPDRFGMVALKKIDYGTDKSYWLVTGNAEVSSL